MPHKAHKPPHKGLQEERRKSSIESVMGIVDDEHPIEKHVEATYPKIKEAWDEIQMRPMSTSSVLPAGL